MKHAADLQLLCWDGLVRCGLDWKSCGLSADWRCCPQCPSTAAHAVLNRRLLRRPSSRIRCVSPDPAPRRSIIGITAATAWSAGRWSARSRHRWDSCTHVPRLLLAYPGHGRRLPLGPCPVPAASGAPSPACRPGRVGTVKGAFRSTLVTRDRGPWTGCRSGSGVASPRGAEGEPVSARRLLVVPVALVSALGLAACGAGA